MQSSQIIDRFRKSRWPAELALCDVWRPGARAGRPPWQPDERPDGLLLGRAAPMNEVVAIM